MSILIDPPTWPAHGTTFSHLVSDFSLEELHDFAHRAGIRERAFDEDHYDVPAERYAELVALGAEPVPGRALVRRLVASGLRVPARQRNTKIVTALRDRWDRLTPESGWLGEELLDRWGEPQRRYHDRTHLLAVLSAVDQLARAGSTATQPRLVQAAVWFHDAVYNGEPGADEAASAELAVARLTEADWEAAEVAEVQRLVLLTAGHDVAAGDVNGAVLSDADLSVLGRDPRGYASYVRAVRAEYHRFSDRDFAMGRLAVLRELAGRDPLFRTPAGHRLWENSARENLAREEILWTERLRGLE